MFIGYLHKQLLAETRFASYLTSTRRTFVIYRNPDFSIVIFFATVITRAALLETGQTTALAVYQDLAPKLSLRNLFTADLQVN